MGQNSIWTSAGWLFFKACAIVGVGSSFGNIFGTFFREAVKPEKCPCNISTFIKCYQENEKQKK